MLSSYVITNFRTYGHVLILGFDLPSGIDTCGVSVDPLLTLLTHRVSISNPCTILMGSVRMALYSWM